MQPETKKILLVEDDDALGYLLSEYLKIKNFSVEWAKNGKSALEILRKNQDFNLAILDVMLPDIDGFDLAGRLQKDFPNLPFLFLTARSLKIDVLKGFSLGAVDYLKKPIDEEELVARIEAILSRMGTDQGTENQPKETYKIGEYTFDSQNQELKHEKESISLTGRESEILEFLIIHKNQLSSHKELLTKIWGKDDYFNRKSLNVFISHLRKYLQKDPHLSIENVHKRGFILKVE
ncbi:DNA-binding response regulator [Christiangramia fulva]|uniref:DNA-binding response regulator n=1 Tax=Christiangramia fulva TaxID=2126553 RepID=A0A2R3Z7J7_9FLAO|nr:response regulator transcription factor [Christiangramia fulva]AVR46253.1 DNA-binding response regulator [Christiangramia fulva]